MSDAVDYQRSSVRDCYLRRTTVCSRPEDRLPVLRKPVGRNERNAVDASRRSLESASLREPSQNGVGETRLPCVLSSDKTVVFLRECYKFVKP